MQRALRFLAGCLVCGVQRTFHSRHYAISRCRRQIEKSPLAQIEMSLSAVSAGGIGPMTVITMSRTEIDRMSVLQDLADGRIKIADASTLMGLGRRQVFRLAKAYGGRGPPALGSRPAGTPSTPR